MCKQKILVIDDSQLTLQILSQMLDDQYEVLTADNGPLGLILAHEYSVDLILLDIVMKDMDGYEVLLELKRKEKTKDIPVIFVTSRDSAEDEIKGLNLGAADYVRKPFVKEIVKLRISTHLKLVSQMKALQEWGLVDDLTGVQNRRSFETHFKSEFAGAMRNSLPLGLILLDMDRMKKLNDTYGHFFGDLCLKATATVVVNSVKRKSDSVYRWGGEEFAVLLPGTSLEGTLNVAEIIKKNITENVITWNNIILSVTASFGVGSVIPNPGDSRDSFFQEVDKALYEAKTNGRNRIEITDPHLA